MKIRERFPRVVMALLCTVGIAGLSGCHHRQIMPQVLAAPQLHAVAMPPLQTVSPPMTAELPGSLTRGQQSAVTEEKPKPAPKKTVAKALAEEPADATSAAPVPDTSVIGELSAGGVKKTETQQGAVGLISDSEKRLDRLSKEIQGQQRAQIRKVRYFLQQAQQALDTGDAEGAKTLAMKAKVLLDDLDK